MQQQSEYISSIKEFERNDRVKLYMTVPECIDRKTVHKYCDDNNLVSKSVYRESYKVLSQSRKCWTCEEWSKDPAHRVFDPNTRYAGISYTCIHCDSWNSIEYLEMDRENTRIKYVWEASGKMLIMKADNIPPHKKDLGSNESFRRYKRSRNR